MNTPERIYTVIDKQTGKEPDLSEITLSEKWAQGLVYCDMEGFLLDEYGDLSLCDECGSFAYCPPDRFEVRFVLPSVARDEALEEAAKKVCDAFTELYTEPISPGHIAACIRALKSKKVRP